MLTALLGVLLLGGFAAWLSARWSQSAPRWLALAALTAEGLLLAAALDTAPMSGWLADVNKPWLARFGIAFHLGLDGLSWLMIALTVLLGFVAVAASWTEIKTRQGFFYFNLLACLAGTVGVFLALDLFLFFVCWELMIVPMYFLISIWGHEHRVSAAIKFFIFTQASSLLMLLAMVVLVLARHDQTGVFSFDYFQLLNVKLDPELGFWLMLGFFIAFAVKLPSLPFHTWLPDAHTQAPTGGSVILAGVLLKTGAYGLLRWVVPLFPEAARQFAPAAMALGAASALYAAMMAFAQSDLKRLIAYTSVSHMGFVMVGVFAWNFFALQGSVVTMLAHGLSAAALFMIAGALQQRLHSRELADMGGLWPILPRLSALTLLFALASLGLPGLGNFIGEFLVLLGVFKVNALAAAVTALTLVLAPVYALRLVQQVVHGPPSPVRLADCSRREWAAVGLLALATVWLGLGPQTVLDIAAPALQQTMQSSAVRGLK